MAVTRRGRFILDHRNRVMIPYPSVVEAINAIPLYLAEGHILRPTPVASPNPIKPQCVKDIEELTGEELWP